MADGAGAADARGRGYDSGAGAAVREPVAAEPNGGDD